MAQIFSTISLVIMMHQHLDEIWSITMFFMFFSSVSCPPAELLRPCAVAPLDLSELFHSEAVHHDPTKHNAHNAMQRSSSQNVQQQEEIRLAYFHAWHETIGLLFFQDSLMSFVFSLLLLLFPTFLQRSQLSIAARQKKTQRCNDALRAILEHGSQLDLRNCQDIFIPRQPPIPTKCSHSVFSLLPMPAHHPATRHTHVAMFIYLIL